MKISVPLYIIQADETMSTSNIAFRTRTVVTKGSCKKKNLNDECRLETVVKMKLMTHKLGLLLLILSLCLPQVLGKLRENVFQA